MTTLRVYEKGKLEMSPSFEIKIGPRNFFGNIPFKNFSNINIPGGFFGYFQKNCTFEHSEKFYQR